MYFSASMCALLLSISLAESAIIPFEYQLLDYTPVEFSFNNDIDEEVLTKCCTETANFNFRAYGRDFPLRLQRNCLIKDEFAEETAAQFSDEGTAWQGKLEDQPNSTVDGEIIDGLFEGIILTGDGDKFMVERQFQSDGKGHSLIYKVSSRKDVAKSLFPQEIANDEGSGVDGSGLEIS